MSNESYAKHASKPERQLDREAEVAQKIIALTSKNARLRAEAAKRLGELHEGTPALLVALQDSNSMVRAAAAQALGSTAQAASEDTYQEVTDSLMAAIDDPNDFVCSAAIHSLGQLKVLDSQEQILCCLVDTNPHVVEAAIIALARLGSVEVAESLVPFLDSDNEWIQAAAVRAMGMLEYTSSGPQLMTILQTGLGKNIEDRHDLLLSHTIQAIAKLGVQEAVPLLTQIARHEVGLRSRAVYALIELNAISAAPILIDMLADPGSSLRCTLIRMMMRMEYHPALPIIRNMLNDQSLQVRQTALEAIVSMKDLGSLRKVRQLAQADSNPYLRIRAVNGLVSLLGIDAMQDLRVLSEDVNTFVRQAVALNLGTFDPLPSSGRRILVRLAEQDDSPLITEQAREILARYPVEWQDDDREVEPVDLLQGLVPESIQEETEKLLELLERWQTSLGTLVGSKKPEELNKTDQALSTLIDLLERQR